MEESSIWSLLLVTGYLKVKRHETGYKEKGTSVPILRESGIGGLLDFSLIDEKNMMKLYDWKQTYELEITNFETRLMFFQLVRGWFGASESDY